MEANIIGATGATGKELLNLLLKDEDFKKVNAFVRRDIPKSHEKLEINVIEFNKTEQWKKLVKGDVLFSCLGTTRKNAGSNKKLWEVDYKYQFEFAKAAKENGIPNYVLISSASASTKSPFFYIKMKGQLEKDIRELDFDKTIIFNPPILDRKGSDRILEVWATKAVRFINKIGILKSQKPLPTETLAIAMINAYKDSTKSQSIKLQDILKYVY